MTQQNWQPGETVRVGFLALRVVAAIATPGDGLPDVYELESLNGERRYEFVPHHGLNRVQ